MVKKKLHTARLHKLVSEMPRLIEALEVPINDVVGRMAALEKAGLTYATEHWRKDVDGRPKYFYLLYSQKNGEPRRRDYIGCD